MSEQPTFGLIVTDPDAHRLQAQRKPRSRLSRGRQFASHGPGNRIRKTCKDRDAWNSPADFSIAAVAF